LLGTILHSAPSVAQVRGLLSKHFLFSLELASKFACTAHKQTVLIAGQKLSRDDLAFSTCRIYMRSTRQPVLGTAQRRLQEAQEAYAAFIASVQERQAGVAPGSALPALNDDTLEQLISQMTESEAEQHTVLQERYDEATEVAITSRKKWGGPPLSSRHNSAHAEMDRGVCLMTGSPSAIVRMIRPMQELLMTHRAVAGKPLARQIEEALWATNPSHSIARSYRGSVFGLLQDTADSGVIMSWPKVAKPNTNGRPERHVLADVFAYRSVTFASRVMRPLTAQVDETSLVLTTRTTRGDRASWDSKEVQQTSETPTMTTESMLEILTTLDEMLTVVMMEAPFWAACVSRAVKLATCIAAPAKPRKRPTKADQGPRPQQWEWVPCVRASEGWVKTRRDNPEAFWHLVEPMQAVQVGPLTLYCKASIIPAKPATYPIGIPGITAGVLMSWYEAMRLCWCSWNGFDGRPDVMTTQHVAWAMNAVCLAYQRPPELAFEACNQLEPTIRALLMVASMPWARLTEVSIKHATAVMTDWAETNGDGAPPHITVIGSKTDPRSTAW
jgi:hypothetical protein